MRRILVLLAFAPIFMIAAQTATSTGTTLSSSNTNTPSSSSSNKTTSTTPTSTNSSSSSSTNKTTTPTNSTSSSTTNKTNSTTTPTNSSSSSSTNKTNSTTTPTNSSSSTNKTNSTSTSSTNKTNSTTTPTNSSSSTNKTNSTTNPTNSSSSTNKTNSTSTSSTNKTNSTTTPTNSSSSTNKTNSTTTPTNSSSSTNKTNSTTTPTNSSSNSNSSSNQTTNSSTNSSNSTSSSNSTVMDDYIKNFPQSVITQMATRDGRYHHYLWHQVREGWNKFTNTTQDAFRQIGWEPPHPARNYDANGTASAILDNLSGEDFLYMHRQMIQRTNTIITQNKEKMGNITGWASIPAPGDKDWPVPPNYTITTDESTNQGTIQRKTDSFYNRSILPNEKIFKDPEQLKKMSLGELGARIEVTVHGYIHMRWSSECELGYRNSYRGTIPNIDPKWDNVTYNWLGDSYGSHVHPLFWKIHGWVDDRIEDWRKANGLTTIQWNGTWTGGPMSGIVSVTGVQNSSFRAANAMSGITRGGDSDSTVSVMDRAFQILKESGVPEVGFADDVYVPEWKMK